MAIAVITDSELQADFKDFGQVYALQNARFTGNFFYPSFIEDLDVESRKQPRCSKVSSGWPLCILLALTMGILGGVQTGLAMAAAKWCSAWVCCSCTMDNTAPAGCPFH